jgi:hypothetical protein
VSELGDAAQELKAARNVVPLRGRKTSVILTRASSIRPERMTWLWQGRIPTKTLTILMGQGGLGKGNMLCHIAAQASRGTLAGDMAGEPVTTVWATAEDAVAPTLVPRLMAAGADLERIEFLTVREGDLKRPLVLPDDAERLGEAAAGVGARLLVIDPVVVFLHEKLNAHHDQDVRRALAPLGEHVAEAYDLAAVAVLHINRRTSADPLVRMSGSGGFGNAARSVLLLAHDPKDPDPQDTGKRVLAHAKCNVARKAPSLACRVEGVELQHEGELIPISRLTVDGEHDASAHELLRELPSDPTERSAVTAARDFIEGELGTAGAYVAATEMVGKAKQVGISERTLERAKSELGVVSERVTDPQRGQLKGAWYWHLPERLGST